MTPSQKQALDYINHYWQENGYSPSYRDISGNIGTGLSHVHEIINGLCRKGFLHIDKGRARAIYPIDIWHKLRDQENKWQTAAGVNQSH